MTTNPSPSRSRWGRNSNSNSNSIIGSIIGSGSGIAPGKIPLLVIVLTVLCFVNLYRLSPWFDSLLDSKISFEQEQLQQEIDQEIDQEQWQTEIDQEQLQQEQETELELEQLQQKQERLPIPPDSSNAKTNDTIVPSQPILESESNVESNSESNLVSESNLEMETMETMETETVTETVTETEPKIETETETKTETKTKTNPTAENRDAEPTDPGDSASTDPVAETRRIHREELLRTGAADASALASRIIQHHNNRNQTQTPTTMAFCPSGRPLGFIAGYRNQIMALTLLVMQASHEGHSFVLLDSLWHKDTYGTDTFDPFDFYFDVAHWNEVAMASLLGEGNGNSNNANNDNAAHANSNANAPLPALVLSDGVLHDQWDPSTPTKYKDGITTATATRPYGYGKGPTRLASRYQVYARGNGKYAVPRSANNANTNNAFGGAAFGGAPRNSAEIAMLRGALRPHPDLMAVVERCRDRLRAIVDSHREKKGEGDGEGEGEGDGDGDASVVGGVGDASGGGRRRLRYMTLHARVEPDMQNHPPCKDRKVRSLRDIVAMVEARWPLLGQGQGPPVDVVFMPINRAMLEDHGGTLPEGKDINDPSVNRIAVDNLRVLNRLTGRSGKNRNNNNGNNDNDDDETDERPGMWNGTVPVVEFGSEALEGSVYEHRPSVSGSILNFELALGADVFVGSEVSSFSDDLLAARFYRRRRNHNQNNDDSDDNDDSYNSYKYLPEVGLVEWITPDMEGPPGFVC